MKQFDEQNNDVSTETSTLDAILIEGSENAILHEEVIVQEPAKDDLEEVVAMPEEDSITEDAISPIKDDKKKKKRDKKKDKKKDKKHKKSKKEKEEKEDKKAKKGDKKDKDKKKNKDSKKKDKKKKDGKKDKKKDKPAEAVED